MYENGGGGGTALLPMLQTLFTNADDYAVTNFIQNFLFIFSHLISNYYHKSIDASPKTDSFLFSIKCDRNYAMRQAKQ